jgi:hypothetical protein
MRAIRLETTPVYETEGHRFESCQARCVTARSQSGIRHLKRVCAGSAFITARGQRRSAKVSKRLISDPLLPFTFPLRGGDEYGLPQGSTSLQP